MRVLAGIELDPSTGPGVDAAIGQVAVSAPGLLQALETQLGLLAPRASHAERVASLYGRLRETDGYWSASFEADPWGTASRLVRDRDELAMEGWRGQPVSEHWDALWAVTESISPGAADRWAAVEGALASRAVGIEQLCLVDPMAEWPGAIRRVFTALQAAGVTLQEVPDAPATAHGDLGAARGVTFVPTADGSLQIVRPQAPTAAAEDVAAFLAEHAQSSILVVSPDATLDAALHRAGLPTTGAPCAIDGARDAALQVLPLCLELLWDPADPQVALELLSLPRMPLPRRLATRLSRALRDWPALGSEPWNEALAEFDFTHDGEVANERAERRRERAQTLLRPAVPLGAAELPVELVCTRIQTVAEWARGLAQSPIDDACDWRRAGVQHQTLLRLLDALGDSHVPAPLLARLVDAATDSASVSVPYPAQAGVQRAHAPGAVIRPADIIVWWNFTRGSAPSVRQPGLTRAERAALGEAGIEIPTAGDRAMGAARRWRRPLAMARKQLLLVAPLSAAPGEMLHPHPLWDEIAASMPSARRNAMTAALTVPRPGLGEHSEAPRSRAVPLSRPTYLDRWDVPAGALSPRERESPSGLGALVGCSLQWGLRYPLGISDDRATYRVSVGPREFGSLAHEILAEVLMQPTNLEDPERAGTRAGEIFDEVGPRRVARLFMPGRDGEREETRLTIVQSATTVVRWLRAHGLEVRKVEEKLEREFEGGLLAGRVDLLAGDPAVVVDFKWGGRSRRQKEIREGTAYQLAAYAYAATQSGAPMPEFGYFILRDRLMVGRKGGPFDPDTTLEGPSASQTWETFAVSCRQALASIAAGRLEAPGGREGACTGSKVVDGRLVLATPCDYCSYDALCGLAFGEGEA